MALKEWSYKGFEIEESLKPGADNFQYFFRIKKTGAKKCTYKQLSKKAPQLQRGDEVRWVYIVCW